MPIVSGGSGGGVSVISGARVFRSTTQTGVVTSTYTAVSFDTVRSDTGTYWSAGNPTRLTVPATGIYLVGGAAFFVASVSTQVAIRLNGTTQLVITQTPTGPLSTETLWSATAADYFEFQVWQNSGINQVVSAFADVSPEFWITRLT